MSWWVYKCNSNEQLGYPAYGDWNDFFNDPTGTWGSTEQTPAIAKLRRGDMIIAYQTNRNELVGVVRVRRSCERDTYLYLTPVETIRVKVRPLKKADRKIDRIPALQGGYIATVYPIAQQDALRLLDAARGAVNQGKPDSGSEIEEIVKTMQSGGQGYPVNPVLREAIAERAVEAARRYYEKLGYKVSEHGRPFDLECRKRGAVLYVEVKGTQTAGEEIFLTRNEFKFSQKHPMELFLLHSVHASKKARSPLVSGGKRLIIRPWKPTPAALTPLVYSYSLSKGIRRASLLKR